jgi:hypothetical protein
MLGNVGAKRSCAFSLFVVNYFHFLKVIFKVETHKPAQAVAFNQG